MLDASGAVYLDTQEIARTGRRPIIRANVGAMRAAAMRDADLVITVGRKLDYQLGYGSPAAFPNARFIRIAAHAEELIDNRPGEVAIRAMSRRR